MPLPLCPYPFRGVDPRRALLLTSGADGSARLYNTLQSRWEGKKLPRGVASNPHSTRSPFSCFIRFSVCTLEPIPPTVDSGNFVTPETAAFFF